MPEVQKIFVTVFIPKTF